MALSGGAHPGLAAPSPEPAPVEESCRTSKAAGLSPERHQFLEDLVLSNSTRIVQYATRCARGRSFDELIEEGGDLVAIVYIRAAETLGRIPAGGVLPEKPANWLLAIARNAAFEHLRRYYRHQGGSGEDKGDTEQLEQVVGDVGPADAIADRMADQEILRLIWEKLNVRHRVALYAAYREEFCGLLSPTTVAQLEQQYADYHWSPNALYKAVHDARQHARTIARTIGVPNWRELATERRATRSQKAASTVLSKGG